MRISFYLLLYSLLAVPAYAGEPTIVETDTEIIVEYSGTDEDRQATLKRVEEEEKRLAKEAELEAHKKASAARRAEAKKGNEEE